MTFKSNYLEVKLCLAQATDWCLEYIGFAVVAWHWRCLTLLWLFLPPSHNILCPVQCQGPGWLADDKLISYPLKIQFTIGVYSNWRVFFFFFFTDGYCILAKISYVSASSLCFVHGYLLWYQQKVVGERNCMENISGLSCPFLTNIERLSPVKTEVNWTGHFLCDVKW